MLPVALNIARLKIALVGSGVMLQKRLGQLKEAGGENITVFTEDKLPLSKDNLQGFQVVIIAGIEDKDAFKVGDMARDLGILLNIEDRKDYCDFYYSSTVRRGDLLIGINTHGKSPALSVRIRKMIEKLFPEIWAERLEELGKKRIEWKNSNLSFNEVIKKTNDYIDEKKWL